MGNGMEPQGRTGRHRETLPGWSDQSDTTDPSDKKIFVQLRIMTFGDRGIKFVV